MGRGGRLRFSLIPSVRVIYAAGAIVTDVEAPAQIVRVGAVGQLGVNLGVVILRQHAAAATAARVARQIGKEGQGW